MSFEVKDGCVVGYTGDQTDVTLPSGISSVSSLSYKKFVRVVIPEGVRYIYMRAFVGCSHLQELVLPNSLGVIGERAFSWCDSLQQLVIPEGVGLVDEGAFSNCQALRCVTLPTTLKKIRMFTFSDCFSLEQVIIPEGVEEIDKHAFWNCKNLTHITLPSSIKKIHPEAFNGCPKIPDLLVEREKQLRECEMFCFAMPDFVAKEGVTLYQITEGDGELTVGGVSLSRRKFSYEEYCKIYEQLRQYKLMQASSISSEGYGDQGYEEEIKIHAEDVIVDNGEFFGLLYHGRVLVKRDGKYVTVGQNETFSEGYGDYSSKTSLSLKKRQ